MSHAFHVTFADLFSGQLAFGMPGTPELLILLVIGLLLFGRRLPEVGRWLGQGIVEFKKGIKGINDEIEDESTSRPDPERLETKPSSTEQPTPHAEPAQRDG